MSVSNLPLVSVAMCTYNGAAYLRQQLDSILAQSYPDFELVVVDDASTDETAEILRTYMRKDPRIRVQVNAENLGYNRNFEKAISLCHGEFVAVSDQDDVWEPEKIKTMMNNWPGDAQFIFSLSGTFIGEDLSNRIEAPAIHNHDITDTHHLVFNSPVHGHAVMFKKELLRHCLPFPPDVFYDWWISMHAASMGYIACVPKTLTWHRVHDKNSSRNLVSIQDKKERERQLRQQCAHFIETFMKTPWPRPEEKKSLLNYAGILRSMKGNHFSGEMFAYAWKNRQRIFHYKKKPWVFFSHIKHVCRMSYRGLL